MSYDPEARRTTPLASKLEELIRVGRDGALSVAEYMDACLQDEEHGYYRTKAAIGAKGDFVTAPEISQVFGELIGLWCVVVWQQMGSPAKFNLVELGPGRGTLMADALRAARAMPAFIAACDLHLVETNETLRRAQAEKLSGAARSMSWHTRLDRVPAHPSIVIGNEFLDTFPIEQYQLVGGKWRRRAVGLDEAGRLQFVTDLRETHAPDVPAGDAPPEGTILEQPASDLALLLEHDLDRLAGAAPLAALFVDYGYAATGFGDSLQAVRLHKAEHPLTSPGEADITAHVDFEAFGKAARKAGFAVDAAVPQAYFLGALGILERARRLMSANPAKALDIETGAVRLMAVPGMGDRFKAIGIRSAALPPLPGF